MLLCWMQLYVGSWFSLIYLESAGRLKLSPPAETALQFYCLPMNLYLSLGFPGCDMLNDVGEAFIAAGHARRSRP